MKQKLRVFLTLLLCAVASVGWGQTTYKLEQVNSVEAGGLYVFEQDGYVMNNTVSSSALQTTNSYSTTGLTGSETYVWTLEGSISAGFSMYNVSLTTANKYLNNSSSTTVSLGNKNTTNTLWAFNFQNNSTVVIQNTKNSNRFLGYTNNTSHAYKAYAESNLSSETYPHAIKVYKLVEEGGDTPSPEDNDLALSTTSLVFDLYNDASAKTIRYTTSSTGAVTVSASEYVTTEVNETNKTITVTPKSSVTPSAQTITVSQAADDTYAAGSATFTVTIDDSTPVTATNWEETDLTNIEDGDIFVIVGNNGNNFALANDKGTASAPTAVAVTVNGNYITGNVADNIKWNVSGNATDGYTFYPNGNTTAWLYTTNTNNGVRVGTNDNKAFTIDNGYLKNSGTSRYVGIYDSQDWRCYTSYTTANIANQTFKFYKYVGAAVPMISASDVNLAHDATSGSLTYTLTNAVDGGVMVAESSETWLTVGTPADGNVSLTFEANSETSARTATVTLTYTYSSNQTITKSVSVTQEAAPLIYTTIPALFDAATSTATNVKVTFGGWVISAVKGSNAYLTDNQGNGLIIYANEHGFQVNDVLTGTVSCKLQLYRGSAELTELTTSTEGLTVTQDGTVTAQTIAISDLRGVNTGALVEYKGLTYNGTALVDDNNNAITPYTTLYEGVFENGKVYNVTGIYLQYNTTKEILPRNAEDIEEVAEPSVVPATTSVSVNSEEHTGSIAVTVNNAPDALFEVEWCNASGDAAEYDWITAGRNGDVIEYAIQENTTTEARTAYLRAFIMYNDEKISSDLITVTQAGVVVDYATLPFEYDGNGAMAGDIVGVTTNGLGTYNSSPAIKFDNTDDYLVLKINEAPKALYFDIQGKGNGTWAGTFTVQTSSDGESYTDLKVYTSLTGDVETEMFTDIASNIRYIKWIFTSKETGFNVALGKIIATNVAPETIEVSINSSATGSDGAFYSSVYYSNKTLQVPGGVECLTYKVVDGALTVSKTYNADDVIPADEAVVIKASASGTVTFTVAPTTNVKDTESMLLGVDDATSISEPGYKYYKLTLNAAKEEGTAGFYFDKGVTDGSTINAAANKCYLRVPVDQTNGAKGFVFGEETDGINAIDNSQQQIVEGIYNLAGQCVNKTQKGIYIVNGKKVVIK